MKLSLREATENDFNFILSTWIKSSYSQLTGYRERQSVYHKGLDAFIKKKYDEGELLAFIACPEEDPDIILGFAVFGTDYSLHYVAVKEAFKRNGICKALLNHMYKGRKEIKVSFWTKDIAYIKKHYNVTYDRFKFFK
jgi:ribosomal protein S18 acetylase RimI-like enzyme